MLLGVGVRFRCAAATVSMHSSHSVFVVAISAIMCFAIIRTLAPTPYRAELEELLAHTMAEASQAKAWWG